MYNLEYAPSHQIQFESYIESSLQSLSKLAQEALIPLRILPANFSTEDAEAVLDFTEAFEARKVLQSLRSKFLIYFSPIHQLFTMHKLLQSFARRKKEEMLEMNPHLKVRRKFDTSTKLMTDEHRGSKDCYRSLAITQSEINDFPSASHSHQPASQQSGERHSSTAGCYHLGNTKLINTLNSMNKIASALQSHQRALDICLELLGENILVLLTAIISLLTLNMR